MKNFLGRVLSTIIGNILTFGIIIFLMIVIVFASILSKPTNSVYENNSILELSFREAIMESEMDQSISLIDLSGKPKIYLLDIINSINYAKTDDNIKGLSLKLDGISCGIAQAQDLRNALLDFKKSGKFIYSYSNTGSQLSYYISSVADKLYQNPLGGTLLQGLSTDLLFYKNAGDKYGIEFQVIRHGKFKSAIEPFTRTSMSDENRLQTTELLSDLWDNISTSISASRKMGKDNLKLITDSLYSFVPNLGVKYRVYDMLVQESDYQKILFRRLGLTSNDNKSDFEILNDHIVKLSDYNQTFLELSKDEKIAILYASGDIIEGDGFEGIQSKTYVNEIRKISNDKSIKALVLRINSPGGSANASEEILYELQELKKRKPIVVSFGNVAASGGYYIAQASDKIYAQPNTITGSIGVFGMIPNGKKLLNNFGIDFDGVKTNANSDQLKSFTTHLSETAKNVILKSITLTYDKFVNHVAKNRGLTYEQVDKIGEGRVWSGTRAKQIGLIDNFGDLNDAIVAAADLSGIEEYSTVSFPNRKKSIEEILDKFQGKSIESVLKRELGSDGMKIYKQVKMMNQQKGIQLRFPYDIEVN